jgi:formamidopyrimidine-DNA glycosylase
MPELPEVEARLVYFKREALGRVIERVIATAPNMIKSSRVTSFARALRGRRMVDATRRGKYLLINLDNSRTLILHFGMGGDLFLCNGSSELPNYTRIVFVLDRGVLAFTCPRKICRVMLVDSIEEVPALREMGPEPLTGAWSLAHLESLIECNPRSRIKPLLMDQRRVAGVGNIYADQILFEAGVLPDRRAASLSETEIKRIHRETRRVLRRALRTATDEELPADFLLSRRQLGNGCTRCSTTIEKQTIAGRTAYYCPTCQT